MGGELGVGTSAKQLLATAACLALFASGPAMAAGFYGQKQSMEGRGCAPRTTVDVAAAYVSFRHTPIGSQFSAFAGAPVATPVSLAGDLAAHAVVLSFAMRGVF